MKRRWRQGEWLANTTYWKGTTCSLPWGDGSPAHSWRMKMLYQPALYIWKITFALRIYTYIITFQFCVYHHSFPYIITLGFRLPSPFVCVRHHPSLAFTITFLIPHHLSYVYHRILFMKTIGVPSQSVPEGSWDLSRVIMINKVTILANTYTPI